MLRRERFGRFPSRCSGFTRRRGVEVQNLLGVLLPHVVPEMHVLLTSPLVQAFDPRSRLGLSVAPPFGFRSASISLLTSGPTMPYADFCPAVRVPLDQIGRASCRERV